VSKASKARKRLLGTLTVLCGLLVAVLLPGGVLASGGGWFAQSSGSTQDLAGIAFGGAGRAWAVGAAGAILFSQDAGVTWTPQTSSTTTALRGVAFCDAQTGWVVGDGGVILHTSDGGVTWTTQTSNTAQNLRAVSFSDALHGWAVGDGGTVLATSDGGATWTAQSSGTTAALFGVAPKGTGSGWAVGEGGAVIHTSDGGSNWAAQDSGTTANLTSVAVAGTATAWAVGQNGTIVATANDGGTWVTRVSQTTHDLHGIAFAGATRGWAVGDGGTIVRTADGGSTWSVQASTTTHNLSGVAFIDAQRGAIAGAAGTILTTTDGGVLDSTAPLTRAVGLRASARLGWRNTPQTVTLRASDAGSGVAATYYTLDGQGRQPYRAPFAVSTAGSHRVTYWSVDWAGNPEVRHVGYVNIDTGRPSCRVLRGASGRPGTTARLIFRVDDPQPSCSKAAVTITIYRRTTAVKRIRIASVAMNVTVTYAYVIGVRPGTYTWVVTATDLAGNPQTGTGSGRLRVAPWPLPTTADVQRCLVALRYLPAGAVSGVNDYRTQQAVLAFQAWSGLARDGIAGRQTRLRLANASPPSPHLEPVVGRYAEVFRSLGVALFVNSGSLVRVVHCSTGRPGLATPAGRFAVYMKSTNWYSTEYHSWMPFASFFTGGDAFHGYPDVPAYPASHGCIRLPMPEAPWVYSFLTYGTPVFVF
jgi:photosystem II stability/assembly factor-like uncharacterized protein/lipoprotein-anchoring transpeptidase ErfK/SrfK